MEETTPETNATRPSAEIPPEPKIGRLSSQVVSRHMPPSSAGEVLPNLWVGNLMSTGQVASTTCSTGPENQPSNKVVLTVISVLSNPNLIKFAKDSIEQQ